MSVESEEGIDPIVAAQFAGTAPPVENPADTPPNPPAPGDPPAPPNPPTPPVEGEYKPLPVWTFFEQDMKKVDPEYQLPQFLKTGKLEDGTALTPEMEHQLYVESILENTDLGIDDDPFISNYMQARQTDGFEMQKWLHEQNSRYSFLNMPDDDLMFSMLKETNETTKSEWTDEQIRDYISKLDPIEKKMRANAGRQGLQNAIAEQEKRTSQQSQADYNASVETLNKQIIEQDIPQLLTVVNKLDNIGGIPHSEADRKDFQELFGHLAKIDPQTGSPFFNKILSDDATLYKALYLLYASDKGIITNFKEAYKDGVLEKLGLNKKSEGTGIASVAKAPDSSKFV